MLGLKLNQVSKRGPDELAKTVMHECFRKHRLLDIMIQVDPSFIVMMHQVQGIYVYVNICE